MGVAAIDERCAVEIMNAAPIVREHDAAHAREHSLEMQLPFLQRLAPAVPIVPLVMGYQTAQTARALGDALAATLKGRRALLVASTDLSHYHDAETAKALDGDAAWVPQVWRDMGTTLAAAPLGDQHTAVVLGRPGGPAFRPSEVARLGYLAGIVATILR